VSEKASVTLLVAVRNEGKHIKGFLEHHAKYFDDVVVVHDGKCTDDTLNIAGAYSNVRYFERPGEHNPFPQREWALHNVIPYGTWVAVFDPDEKLSDELLSDLRDKLIAEADADEADAIVVTQDGYVDGKAIRKVPVWRIFKNAGSVHYPEHPHAGPEGLTKATSHPEYIYIHQNSSADYPTKVRRRNAHYRRIIAADPNSTRRAAWEAGMVMRPEIVEVLKNAGISLEVQGHPLTRFGRKLSKQLADELGIETFAEMAGGDTEYIARTLGIDESQVKQMQKFSRRQCK